MFRLPNSLKIFLLMIACLAPQKIWAEQVDTASITKILGTENLLHPDVMDDEVRKKLLDSLANSETILLDPNNRDWKASSPKWKPIYDRIHADLEQEMPSIVAKLTA